MYVVGSKIEFSEQKSYKDLEAFETLSDYELHKCSKVGRKLEIFFNIQTYYCTLYHL